jgi:hypothetical protein
VASREPHEVDEFIDSGLRRHAAVTWSDLEVPADLQAVAEATWEDLARLADHHGADPEIEADLDRQAERYDLVVAQAAGISYDLIQEARADGRRQGADGVRREMAAKATTRPTASREPPARPTISEMPVGQVGGRDLLKVVAGRLRRKATGPFSRR